MEYFNVELLNALKKDGFTTLATAYENCKDIDVGFKRCGNALVALRLPARDETTFGRFVHNPSHAKFRAKYIPEVLFVYNVETDKMIPKILHHWQGIAIVYEVGKQAHPDKYDPEKDNVCSHGIHFYLTLESVICYDPYTGCSFGDNVGPLTYYQFQNVIKHCIVKLKCEKK